MLTHDEVYNSILPQYEKFQANDLSDHPDSNRHNNQMFSFGGGAQSNGTLRNKTDQS